MLTYFHELICQAQKNTGSSYKFRTIETLTVETESIYLLASIQSTSCQFDSSFATY
jgi:hypothetical protein